MRFSWGRVGRALRDLLAPRLRGHGDLDDCRCGRALYVDGEPDAEAGAAAGRAQAGEGDQQAPHLAACVPSSFRFAAKMPKNISHEHKLVGCDALVAQFGKEVAGLGDKLGVVLVQLPPSLVFDVARLVFFQELSSMTPAAVVCEPRHPTWFTPAADVQLAALRVGRVAADPVLFIHFLYHWKHK